MAPYAPDRFRTAPGRFVCLGIVLCMLCGGCHLRPLRLPGQGAAQQPMPGMPPAELAVPVADHPAEWAEESEYTLAAAQAPADEQLPAPAPLPAGAARQPDPQGTAAEPQTTDAAPAAAPPPGVCPPGGWGPPSPREFAKVTLATYVIEPPDLLYIESNRTLPNMPITGERLVRPDGKIYLGPYGSVRVAGLTLEQAKEAIEQHLGDYIQKPRVNVDIYAYNSKFYYVIADGAGYGEIVARFPFTANETVLDAVSQIGGLPQQASKKRIWIARPAPGLPGGEMILPVDWRAIAQDGIAAANYQILPGDRVYIQSDRLMAFNGVLTKFTAPLERLLGVTLLGATTVKQYQNLGRSPGGVGGGGVGLIGGF